jgi:hypothetical protein
MSDVLLVSLLIFIAFSCAMLAAEWAAGRVRRSLRDQRERGLTGNVPDPPDN